MPLSRGTLCDINLIYTPLESTFNGLQLRRYREGTTSICLAVIGLRIYEIWINSREFELIVGRGHSRSSILVLIESAYATSY